MIAVADASPLHYLVLIDRVDGLSDLFETVITPPAVRRELAHPRTPATVRAWMATPPPWLRVAVPTAVLLDVDARLGDGEREALALAAEHPESVLLLDDFRARQYARQHRWPMLGTLALLDLMARRRPAERPFEAAVARLRRTNFRADAALLRAIRQRGGTET